jgi:DNA-nicking Smr family endonuclease
MGKIAMKRHRTKNDCSEGSFRPFENLRDLLDGRSQNIRSLDSHRSGPDKTDGCSKGENPQTEQELFADAMADVTPITGTRRHAAKHRHTGNRYPKTSCEQKTLEILKQLVDFGHGFEVSHTPEYMEGRGYRVSREVTRRLYNGDFAVQDHIDLHGFNVAAARDAFMTFMEKAVTDGKRAVLIVHGRGLSSPVGPVLKRKVYGWLTRGPIRKWVLAFTSARSCDGGAGATYVLLRLRPVTKRFRKNRDLQLKRTGSLCR